MEAPHDARRAREPKDVGNAGNVVNAGDTAEPPEPAERRFVIRLQAAAPAKPAEGESCNGCGVCCASEPCPLGVLASRRRSGSCAALVWNDADSRYRCGLVSQPAAHLPRPLRPIGPLIGRAALRLISGGSGCDCSLQVVAD